MPKTAKPKGGRKFLIPLGFLALAALVVIFLTVPFGKIDVGPARLLLKGNGDYSYSVPLDPKSPWPKFRANELQTGRSPVLPAVRPGLKPWVFRTGKGIFSSPVVGGDGSVYIGSADQSFYALRPDGSAAWSILTGGVIDSAALLDDRGRVFVGSGDGKVYCMDRASGSVLWTARAHSAEEAAKQFGVVIHNVGWFEGNIAMLGDGTVLAPNDNQLLYAFDRDDGALKRVYRGNEMIWSLPAVDTRRGRIYFATQNLALKVVFAYEVGGRKPLWTTGRLGSEAASILLTSDREGAALITAGFDGYVRALQSSTGKQLWKFPARDHIYASPAQLSDGTLVEPSADGTVYGLDPTTGRRRWSFDAGKAIRSSPAVDGRDEVYVGGGDGRLYCLNPDGSLRWSYRCIEGDRDDLNSSPALGPTGVVVGGEDGGVFFVPYDYPLTEEGRKDPRSSVAAGLKTRDDGASLVYTTSFGYLEPSVPASIDANARLAFTLIAKSGGSVIAAMLDPASLRVSTQSPSGGPSAAAVNVDAAGHFLTISPKGYWTDSKGGRVTFRVSGSYRTGMWRFGLKAFGGRETGSFDESFGVDVPARGRTPMPYAVPAKPGDPATAFDLSRGAAPNPSILPSWNQIGFDSLHYIAGIVEGGDGKALAWVIAGKYDPATGTTVVDPSLAARYPLNLDYDGGLVTLSNYRGFKINFVGSWDMPFGFYRLAARADPVTGAILGPAGLDAVALCDQVRFYGLGLKILGLSDWKTGKMTVAGAFRLETLGKGPRRPPSGAGSAAFSVLRTSRPGRAGGEAAVSVSGGELKESEHNFSLLLVDASDGEALPLYYTGNTLVHADPQGRVDRVSVSWSEDYAGRLLLAYYLVDAYPVAEGELRP